jgi:formate hydrogenlyase subunit 3/multisubunit Na+/H+ antiporter MnhD subunit
MSAEGLVLILSGVVALLAFAVAGAFAAHETFSRSIVYGGSLAIAAVMLAVALAGLLDGANGALVLPLGLPWIGAHFRFDALSSLFLVIVNLGAATGCLYGLGYGRMERAPERVLPFFPAFPAAMNLVVVADDAYTFLLSWEFMSLASWALVMAHHREGDNARAGYVYLLMASFGALALLLAFALLAGAAGGYAFDAMRAARPSAAIAGLAFMLALIGAGSKAGVVPLHVWLPLAHPAAPSHVSALMSGVMTKVAVYGFVRIVFDLMGPAGWWWSIPVLTVGAGTALLGVIYALMQHDLKRLLAYHTVENIGIIFIGLGLALGF